MDLFSEIHKVFKNTISSDISIIEYMLFLFHYDLHKSTCIEIKKSVEENYFYRIYNGNIKKSNKLWNSFNYDLDWDFDTFTQHYNVSYSDIEKQLNKELATLLYKYTGITSEAFSNQESLKILMFLQSQSYSNKIMYPFIKCKYRPCQFYERRISDEEIIIQKLKKDHVVFFTWPSWYWKNRIRKIYISKLQEI